jgi:hypothetical protein
MINVSELLPQELLVLHSEIAEELRARGITRTLNNPTGDLAEYLFCKAFGWHQANNSHAKIDAIDSSGIRYQIKGRRITRKSKSRQLGAIRDLAGAHFEFLASVLFTEEYAVLRAAIIPCSVVNKYAHSWRIPIATNFYYVTCMECRGCSRCDRGIATSHSAWLNSSGGIKVISAALPVIGPINFFGRNYWHSASTLDSLHSFYNRVRQGLNVLIVRCSFVI